MLPTYLMKYDWMRKPKNIGFESNELNYEKQRFKRLSKHIQFKKTITPKDFL